MHLNFLLHSGPNVNFVAVPFSASAKLASTFTPDISRDMNWYVEYLPLNKTLAIPELYTNMLAQRLGAKNRGK